MTYKYCYRKREAWEELYTAVFTSVFACSTAQDKQLAPVFLVLIVFVIMNEVSSITAAIM